MNYLQAAPGTVVELAASVTVPEMVHVLAAAEIDAINAALAARRPLLVRGEPGIGKSQLARAAAKALGRVFLSQVVDSRTESRDLLWHFDAVARLADAQLFGALGAFGVHQAQADDAAPQAAAESWERQATAARRRLAPLRYVQPRALWWAFDWADAQQQAATLGIVPPPQPDGGCPENGSLVLIDEIDKAESDVPNGLLEALGAGCFTPFGRHASVQAVGAPPLVVITTNEERSLPDAFLRRCLVLHLRLPAVRTALIAHLVDRARAHFPRAEPAVLEGAAELLVEDRDTAQREHWLPLPGQAEYLDLVRAVLALAEAGTTGLGAEDILKRVGAYVLRKHPDAVPAGEPAA